MNRRMALFASAAGAALLVALSGCGGDAEPNVQMPEVKGQRLDVALSDLDGIGVAKDSVEIVGGGVFGVIDESGWVVCSQDPAATQRAEAVRLVVDRSCPDMGEGAAAEPSSSPESPTEHTDPADNEGGDDVVDTFRMPALVGENLQRAQDELQARGSYLLDQQDASGLGRLQLFDSNWVVCAQVPRAGKRVPADRIVTLAAVKIGESCG